jgi:hypothetical protein
MTIRPAESYRNAAAKIKPMTHPTLMKKVPKVGTIS